MASSPEDGQRGFMTAELPHGCDLEDDAQLVDDKPFPFLQLPGEIRNRVYTHLTPAHDYSADEGLTDENFYNHNKDFPRPCTFLKTDVWLMCWRDTYLNYYRDHDMANLGVTQACKQLRIEFRPMFWPYDIIVVPTYGLDKFIAAFFSPEAPPPSTLKKVMVIIARWDCWDYEAWNIVPLLAAVARYRNVRWEFHDEDWSLDPQRNAFRYADVRPITARVVNSVTRSMRSDLETDLFESITLLHGEWDAGEETVAYEWHVVARTGSGRFNRAQKKRMEAYCKILTNVPGHEKMAGRVKIDVKRRNGRVVEKYRWNASSRPLVRVKGGKREKK